MDPPTQATVCRPFTTLPRPMKSGSPPKALAFTGRYHQLTPLVLPDAHDQRCNGFEGHCDGTIRGILSQRGDGMSDWDEFTGQLLDALRRFVQGDAEPYKSL